MRQLHRSASPAAPSFRRGVTVRLAACTAALVALGAASIAIVAPSAGASSAAPASAAAPAQAPPNPPALAAQSANLPFALQLLGRFYSQGMPTDQGAAPIAAQLDAGQSVRQVVGGVARSWTGIREIVTDGAYPALLHRSIDPGGQAYVTAQVGAGRSIEWVFASLAASAEFRAANPTVADQVDAIYSLMLRRSADSAGLAYFSGLVAGGMPVDRVVYSLKGSSEYANGTITREYRRLLRRSADNGGRAFWATRIGQLGQLGLDVSLASSPESQQYGCDPLAAGTCMLPWPNNFYTRPTRPRPQDCGSTSRRVSCRPTPRAPTSARCSSTAATASAPARRWSCRCLASTSSSRASRRSTTSTATAPARRSSSSTRAPGRRCPSGPSSTSTATTPTRRSSRC